MTTEERVARIIQAIEATPSAPVARELAVAALKMAGPSIPKAAEVEYALTERLEAAARDVLERHPEIRADVDVVSLAATLLGQVVSSFLSGRMDTAITLRRSRPN